MTETDDVLAQTRREHGDEVAEMVARFIAAPAKKKRSRSPLHHRVVGVKLKHPKPIPTSHSTNKAWRQDLEEKWAAAEAKYAGKPGYGPTGLPFSGAPNPPKRDAGASSATREQVGQ